jgi:hypothetical protein
VKNAAVRQRDDGLTLSPNSMRRMVVGVLATLLLYGHGTLTGGEVKEPKFIMASSGWPPVPCG